MGTPGKIPSYPPVNRPWWRSSAFLAPDASKAKPVEQSPPSQFGGVSPLYNEWRCRKGCSMSETTTVELDWPGPGNGLMAWAPPGNSLTLAAVPVTTEQVKAGLTTTAYREALARRVEWLIEKEPDPQAAVDELREALEERDLWPGVAVQATSLWGQVAELLTDNPLWPDYLNTRMAEPPQGKMAVRPIPAAVQAVKRRRRATFFKL